MRRFLQSRAAALLGLAAVVLLVYGGVLFSGGSLVLSQPGTDLTAGEADGKDVLLQALRSGRIPQWNPHIFSGIPMVGELQSGVFYPLNLILLPFALTTALNLHVALHTWLLGAGMLFWTRHRGFHPLACFSASAVVMLAGPVTLHVYAGHLMNLAAMAWAPFLFLAADRIFHAEFRKGILLGSAAMAAQIFTGQAQYVYYSGIALGIYCLLRLASEPGRLKAMAALGGFAIGGVALSAVQLIPGVLNIRESVRGGKGLGYEFAAMFSFPPENILTLIAPGIFGNMVGLPYWGRCYLWEMCLFFGTTGFLLALYGLWQGTPQQRRWSGTMVILLFILALGSHTPLFRILYEYAPGFKSLRGNSKFIFPCLLFLGMLAAAGIHTVIGSANRSRIAGIAALGAAALAFAAALSIVLSGGTGWWASVLQAIFATRESYLPAEFYANPEARLQTAGAAAGALFWASSTMMAAGAIWLIPVFSRFRALLLCVLAVGEVLVFARVSRVAFDLNAYREQTGQIAIRDFLAREPGDYRILQLLEPNSAMFLRAQNIWGYGAIPSRRYLEFIAFTQGINPDEADQYINFTRLPPIYRILRCRFGFVPEGKELRVLKLEDPLPHFQLVRRHEIVADRDGIFRRLASPDFDPRETVLLESDPAIGEQEAGSPGGEIKMVQSTPDRREFTVDLDGPAVLLITDPFSPAWSVREGTGRSPQAYAIVPANYVLMGIPLSGGHHHLIMECVAPGYVPGKWITAASLLAWLGAAAFPMLKLRTSRA